MIPLDFLIFFDFACMLVVFAHVSRSARMLVVFARVGCRFSLRAYARWLGILFVFSLRAYARRAGRTLVLAGWTYSSFLAPRVRSLTGRTLRFSLAARTLAGWAYASFLTGWACARRIPRFSLRACAHWVGRPESS